MTAPNVIAFPIIPRPQAIGDLDEITLSPIRLPRASYGKLCRFAAEWGVDIGTAVEMLLMATLNEKKSK